MNEANQFLRRVRRVSLLLVLHLGLAMAATEPVPAEGHEWTRTAYLSNRSGEKGLSSASPVQQPTEGKAQEGWFSPALPVNPEVQSAEEETDSADPHLADSVPVLYLLFGTGILGFLTIYRKWKT